MRFRHGSLDRQVANLVFLHSETDSATQGEMLGSMQGARLAASQNVHNSDPRPTKTRRSLDLNEKCPSERGKNAVHSSPPSIFLQVGSCAWRFAISRRGRKSCFFHSGTESASQGEMQGSMQSAGPAASEIMHQPDHRQLRRGGHWI